MTHSVSLLIVVLGALLPAQETQSLGVFPEALYAVQPALDQVLHLSDEQAAKIASRSAPFREELRLLEEETAATEPAQRGEKLAKLDATRAEVEPTLQRIVESVLAADQKNLVAMGRELHAAALRAAAEELGERARKGQTSRLEALVHDQILRLCPGLESTDVATSESALRASLAKSVTSQTQVTPPVASDSQPPATSETKPEKKRKDLLRDAAEGALKGALESVVGELFGK